jgi:hypothetical protein
LTDLMEFFFKVCPGWGANTGIVRFSFIFSSLCAQFSFGWMKQNFYFLKF